VRVDATTIQPYDKAVSESKTMTDTEKQIADLRRALAHLHDPAYLENHPLAVRISSASQAQGMSRGQLLSRILRLAIESLDPGAEFAPTTPEARPYHILRNRYIARQSIPVIANQLGIGERQAYRELKRGVLALINIISEYESNQEPVDHTSSPAARVRAEINRLTDVSHQVVDIRQLVEQVIQNVEPMARSWGVQIQWEPEVDGLQVKLNRVVLRQALFNLLSHVIRRCQGSDPVVRFKQVGESVSLEIIYTPIGSPDLHQFGQPYAMASELLNSLGVHWERQENDQGEAIISIRIPLVERHRVLIVDDNAGLIRLFERYLNDQPFLVHSTTSAEQALHILADLKPDIIILDVMMPTRDGWEVLQEIRQNEAGAQAKVLVCSIINDPDLAAAMGADGFLHKPVDRASLLQALKSLSLPNV
jgi:CheY-like chemotaxis protein